MKIEIIEKGLMIVPESDFEEGYIKSYMNEDCKTFVKTGSSADDVIGLKIQKQEPKGSTVSPEFYNHYNDENLTTAKTKEGKIITFPEITPERILELKLDMLKDSKKLSKMEKVNRLEVIDTVGRKFVNYDVNNIEISLQDNNKTLKLFING